MQKPMNKTKLNYFIDIIITVLFLIVAFTGLFIYLFIPEGVSRGRYQEYMGISKALWTLIHSNASILLTIGIGLHVILHKKWINCVTASLLKNEDNSCNIYETNR